MSRRIAAVVLTVAAFALSALTAAEASAPASGEVVAGLNCCRY
jgi:hypothetical protein